MTYILLSLGLIANRTRQHRIQSWRAVGMSRMHQPYACSRYYCLQSYEMVFGGKQRQVSCTSLVSIKHLAYLYIMAHTTRFMVNPCQAYSSVKQTVNHTRNAGNKSLVILLNQNFCLYSKSSLAYIFTTNHLNQHKSKQPYKQVYTAKNKNQTIQGPFLARSYHEESIR